MRTSICLSLFLVLSLMCLTPGLKAGDSDLYDVYLTSSPSPATGATSLFLVNGSEKGIQTCLTRLTFQAGNFPAAGTTLSVLGAATAAYSVTLTTTIPPFIEYWDYQNALCLPAGTSTYIQVSSGTTNLNVIGYARSKRD